MSEQDREKWDARYAGGAYGERTAPSVLVEETLAVTSGDGSRALDLACGAGRNALYLAERGYAVDAVDISAVALERAARTAAGRGLHVNWIPADLDESAELEGTYRLIVMIRYVNVPLLVRLVEERLEPGGMVIAEEHLRTDADVIGPRNDAFRVAPGALREALAGLTILRDEEGVFVDPDGRPVALSRIVAVKPATTDQGDECI